ncbi:MAG TPA: hypothetical protein VK114_00980 [Nitrososphaerales archaeon]|nr:hypothetical protein [Nitrososphaerales archaeon]
MPQRGNHVIFSVSVPPEIALEVERRRGGVSRSVYISGLLQEALARKIEVRAA